ncbi:thermonuclease family protein (plasmid) [Rhodobacteraceae bacterium SC52]|nr:thermonuclease family protein [Rhodobacteraceae bacterium SC52]
MPFSQDNTDRIKASLQAALASQALSDWQRSFLADMEARFEQYGTRTRLSDKQYAKLKQILAPFDIEKPPSKPQRTRPRPKPVAAKPRPARPSSSRPRPPSPLRTIRKARRSMRNAVWIAMVVVAVIGGLVGLFETGGLSGSDHVASSQPSRSDQTVRSTSGFSITDGDTVQIHGASKGTRLVGFNTPETYRPRCDRELALGQQATARLKSLVRNADQVDLQLVACACPPATQGTDACNFGRSCGVLRVDGRDVGDILIAEGLAVAFHCGATSCPRMPRPWCG